MKDHWKSRTLFFKTLFHLFRYRFQFPRYRRVKERVIFNRLRFSSLSHTRISRSRFIPLTYLKLQTSDSRDSWKNVIRATPGNSVHISKKRCRSLDRGPIHNPYATLIVTGHFESLYLDIQLRYRDKTKTDFNGTVSFISCGWFHDKIFNFYSRFLRESLQNFIRRFMEVHLITLHKWRRDNLTYIFTRYFLLYSIFK